jgi:acyl carrier protein
MRALSVEEFYKIVSNTLRLKAFRLDLSMGAKDVPGWDSLRHLMLILELNRVLEIDLSPEETAGLANLGALFEMACAAAS